MSRSSETVVDSRVVELTLNNREFESNAARSISTISKLKDSLDFSDAGKGLDEISKSAKNINLDKLNSGLEAASRGFSAMEAVAFGAFANIGAKISDTALKVGKMFVIDPVTDGFREYELKMDSVQTIMASTGESLEAVNGYLEELNLYADKTIYSFSDMTNSIGKFTNAGVSLKDAVAAIQGISNEAAVSGANSEQASRAMYNFAQALSSGFVKLIDWKSIENANMATVEFKDQLLQTAVELGTVRKEADGTYKVLTHGNGSKGMQETISATKNFNDSLQHQWMTTEVLTKTLAKYSDETTEIGKKAFQAATEVKTFGQLVDTLKEAAGSGWAQTWEILIGDFNQAKELFTFLSDRIGGLIDGFSRSRNDFLKAAMGAPTKYVTAEDWENLDLSASKAKSLSAALIEVGKASGIKFSEESVDGLVESLSKGWLTADKLKEALNMGTADFGQTEEELEKVRDAARRVIRGDYGNDMAERFRLLEEEGFDPQQVQDYVNALHKAAGGTWNLTEEVYKEADAVVFTTEALASKSDEELKALGWSEKRIKNLRKLQKQAEETGTPLNQLIADLDKPQKSGRDNLFGSIRDIFDTIKSVTFQVQRAWASIFPKADADKFRNMTAGLKDLTQKIKMFAVNKAQKIFQVFRGLFSVLDIGIRIVKTIGGVILNVLGKALGALLPPIGNALVYISNLLSKFRDWVVENQIIEGAMTALGGVFDFIGSKIKLVFDKIGSIFEFGGRVVGLFMTRLEHLGGFSFENVIKSFNFVKRVVFDYLDKKFPAFAKFRETVSNAFGAIGGVFKNVGSSVSGFFSSLMQNEAVKNGITKIKTKFTGAFGKIAKAIKIGQVAGSMFMKKIKELGGFSFKNVVTAFNDVKDRVFNYLDKKHPGFKKFREQFSELGTKIKDTLANLGLDSEGIKSKWKAFSGFAIDTFWKVYNGAKDIGGKIVTKVKEFLANPIVQENMNKFKSGFSQLWDSLKPFFGGFDDAFKDFLGRVEELGGFSFDNIGGIWEAFKASIGEHFKNFTGFDGIKEAFSGIWTSIVQFLEDNGINLEAIQQKISEFATTVAGYFGVENFSLPDIFTNLVNFFMGNTEETSDTIEDSGKTIGKSLKKFGENLKTAAGLENFSLGEVFDGVVNFIGGFFSKDADTLTKDIETKGDDLAGAIGGFATKITETTGIKNFSISQPLSNLISLFTDTAKMIVGANEEVPENPEDENPVTRLVLNFLRELKEIIKELPLGQMLAAFTIIETVTAFANIAKGIKMFGMAAEDDADESKIVAFMEGLSGVFTGLAEVMAAILGLATLPDQDTVNEVLGKLTLFFAGITSLVTAASVLMNKFGLVLPSSITIGGGGTSLSAGWTVLQNFLGNFVNKTFIATLIPLAGEALYKLADADVDSDKLYKSAEAVSLIIASAVGVAESVGAIGKLGIDSKAALKGLGAVGVVLGGLTGGASIIGGILRIIDWLRKEVLGQDISYGQTAKDIASAIGDVQELMTAVGGVIGGLIGGIAGGIAGGFAATSASGMEKMTETMMTALETIADKLPGLAESLKTFFEVLQPISDGTYTLDVSKINEVFLMIGEISMIGLIDACNDFMVGLLDGDEIDGKKMGAIDHVTEAMDKVSTALIDWDKKLSGFSSVTLPDGLSDLTEEIKRISGAGLATAMDSFASSMLGSASNGLIGLVTGQGSKSSIDYFTEAVGAIAGVVQFWTDTFGTEGDHKLIFDKEGFDALVESVKQIPTGGLADVFGRLIGADSATGEFAGDMKKLAEGISNFATIAGGVSITESVMSAVNAISILAKAAADVGDDSVNTSFYDAFVNLLGSENGETSNLAEGLNTFVTHLRISPENLATLTDVAKSARSLGYYAKSLATISVDGTDMTNIYLIQKFCTNIKDVVDAISYTTEGDYTSVDAFSGAVETIASAGLTEAAKAWNENNKEVGVMADESLQSLSDFGKLTDENTNTNNSKLIEIANGMIGAMLNTFSSDETKQKSSESVATLTSNLTASLDTHISEFYSVGKNFVDGFANGIGDPFKVPKLWKRAWDLGQTALAALRASIASHSPSRESGKLGTYFWQGFAFKMEDGADAVYRSSHGLGQAAINGLSRSVRAINAMIDSGLNTEPVIRPVLDMSNIQNGSLALGGMLGNGMVGVSGNLSAINANVNARNVTTNGDILTALNELGSALNRRPATTNQYTINGITYDDGSNVSSAVRSLIHAARIERRV